jgi:TnpA family transposase
VQANYRASGLNLVVATTVLWNTVYLEHVCWGLEMDSAVTVGSAQAAWV